MFINNSLWQYLMPYHSSISGQTISEWKRETVKYWYRHGPLARYEKLRVAHAPGTFSLPPRVHNPDMHHGSCVTHVPWYMPGLLTSGFLRSQWKRSRNSRRMHNPQCYVSGKRPMASHRRPEQGLHENNLKCGYGSGIKQVPVSSIWKYL